MESFFEPSSPYPDGFAYFPAFLTREEEASLLEEIKKIPLHTFMFQGYEALRKVASFGFDYDFDAKSLQKGQDIPSAFLPLIEKVAQHLSLESRRFAELLVTEYPPGAVINWHRDAFPFEIIAGISLLSSCTFRLRPHDKRLQNKSRIISIPVHPRSLYVIKGDARLSWQHSTLPVRNTRYSLTLRTLYEDN